MSLQELAAKGHCECVRAKAAVVAMASSCSVLPLCMQPSGKTRCLQNWAEALWQCCVKCWVHLQVPVFSSSKASVWPGYGLLSDVQMLPTGCGKCVTCVIASL